MRKTLGGKKGDNDEERMNRPGGGGGGCEEGLRESEISGPVCFFFPFQNTEDSIQKYRHERNIYI